MRPAHLVIPAQAGMTLGVGAVFAPNLILSLSKDGR